MSLSTVYLSSPLKQLWSTHPSLFTVLIVALHGLGIKYVPPVTFSNTTHSFYHGIIAAAMIIHTTTRVVVVTSKYHIPLHHPISFSMIASSQYPSMNRLPKPLCSM